MPKCVFVGCDQTAFYGLVYNQPRFCKTHADGSGSVKKKCAFGDCSNATLADLCSRCSSVQITIQSFKEIRLGELDTLIKKENSDRLRVELAGVRPSPPASLVPVLVPSTVRRAPKSSVNPVLTPMPLLDLTKSSQQVPSKARIPKIVRTPDEPKPVTSAPVLTPDPVVMKKRTQTPGRARSVS